MRLLMPSHAKMVQPIAIHSRCSRNPRRSAARRNVLEPVTLKSALYSHQSTEALVAIDVNSGRSTREHNIEDTRCDQSRGFR